MRILFIIPGIPEQVYYITYPRPSQPHLGIAYLTSTLQSYKINVEIMDMRLGYHLNSLFETIEKFDPDIIGITSYSEGYTETYKLIDQIKSHGNHLVVIGGPHVSAFRNKVLQDTKVDFAIKGEGEYTLLELCKEIEKGAKNLEGIKGLLWKNGDEIVENADRPYIKDLDALPFPAFEKFELEKYRRTVQFRTLPIITSRGCPYQCTFCSVRLLMGNKFRARSPKNVVDEIEYRYRKGWKKFDVYDDCFTFDLERAMEICRLIIKRGLKIRYYLPNGIRVDRINKELLQKMKESGCNFTSFGVESGDSEILKKIKKGITVKQVEEAIKMTNEVGIANCVSLIIGHPGETYEKALKTLKLAETLPADYVNIYNLVPYPGTELFQWIVNNATFLHPPEVYLNQSFQGKEEPIFETKEFTADERRRVLKIGLSLAQKKHLQFKLGRNVGYITYLLTRSTTLRNIISKIFFGTKTGRSLLQVVTALPCFVE